MAETFEVWSDISDPVTTDAQGAIKKAINLDAVKVSIDNILKTRQTERVMRPTFGSRLTAMVFEPIDEQMFNTFTDGITDAINRWDQRVSVASVSYATKRDRNFVQATIYFTIRGYEEVFEHTTLI